MGKPISLACEREVQRLLRGKISEREIAELTGISRGTVQRIRMGVTVERSEEPEEEEPVFRPCDPYVCFWCSEEAGHQVKSCYTPCVACSARHPADSFNATIGATT